MDPPETVGEDAGAVTSEASPQEPVRKVVVMYKATGDAPILKQTKFKIDASENFAKVVDFLRRQLRRDSLFVYLNSAFSPSLDEKLSSLADSFGIDGKLVVNYSLTPAWG